MQGTDPRLLRQGGWHSCYSMVAGMPKKSRQVSERLAEACNHERAHWKLSHPRGSPHAGRVRMRACKLLKHWCPRYELNVRQTV